MRRDKIAAFLLSLAVLSAAFPDGVRLAHALDIVQPTPEQERHCGLEAEERHRKNCLAGYAVARLKFPDGVEELGFFSSVSGMGIYKPAGDGPFPALLVLHTCGRLEHAHLAYWVEQALASGYVAFVVDSWEQRGLSAGICTMTPRRDFNPVVMRVRDAYDALGHLGKFAFVDGKRVAAIGFSHGGRVAYLLASKTFARMFQTGDRRFAAAVAIYGECYGKKSKRNRIYPDIDVPLLALLGEKDADGDPAECVPRLEALKDKGAPVSWHVYPGMGHAWDNPRFSPPRRVSYTGHDDVLFGYDPAVRDDTRDKAFAFLARGLKRQ